MSNQNRKQKTENEPLAESLNILLRTKSSQIISPKDITSMFENLLPPHTDEEKRILAENIVRDGEIRNPLIIWKNGNLKILVDGLLRHQIALKLEIDCPVIYKEFESVEEAKAFVFSDQLGRRNLSVFCLCELALLWADTVKVLGQGHQSLGGKGCHIKDEDRIDAKKILGEKAGVSHDTFAKAKKISREVNDPEVLNDLRKGKRTITNVYSEITGKNSKPVVIQKELFDSLGNLVTEWSRIKNVNIVRRNDGSFKIEVTSIQNEKQVCETTNQILVKELGPTDECNCVEQSKPITRLSEQTKPSPPEANLLHLLYDEYNFDTISNPYWEDLRSLYIREVRKIDKYVSLSMDEKSEFRKYTEKLRLELLKNWEEKNQPLGGGRKTEIKIIREFKKFKDFDASTIQLSDDSGTLDILNTGKKFTSGLNQYFPEMMDTPTQSGTSPMDVIKDSEIFLKFMERVIVYDGLHLFTKSLEYKTKKAA